jgi:hypothetical protein
MDGSVTAGDRLPASTNSPQFPPIEPLLLSPVERLLWRLEEKYARGFRVMILIRLEGCIDADVLATALRHLQHRHPKLRAAMVAGDDERPYYHFAPDCPAIPVEITDYDQAESPWRDEVRRLMQRDFPATGPLVAVAVLRRPSARTCELLLTVHHGIADGLSAIMLVDDLLTEYARVEADPLTMPRPAFAPVDAPRAKGSGGWLNRLRMMRRVVRLQREEVRSRPTSLPRASDIPPHSQWVHWVFSREETVALVRRCRAQQVSVAAALVGVALRGLIDCLPGSNYLFKCTFPFDLREYLEGPSGPVTVQDAGAFVSIMNEYFEFQQPPTLWEVARQAHLHHETFARQGGPSFYYNLAARADLFESLRFVRRFLGRRSSSAQAPASQRVTLLSTNYGVATINDKYGSLRTRECTLLPKHDIGGPFLVLEALVLGGRLNIGFAADSLDPAFWGLLQVAVRTNLASVISGA